MNKTILFVIFGVGLLVAAIVSWQSSGYGKISKPAYQFATALHSICNAKSESRLAKIEGMIQEATQEPMVIDDETFLEKESVWLQRIIEKAKSGQWETAAKNSRRMMQDQVTK